MKRKMIRFEKRMCRKKIDYYFKGIEVGIKIIGERIRG
jgi:hypothetical protein